MSIPERFKEATLGWVAADLGAALRQASSRFRVDQRGASAVEFALIAIPFFALTCGTIETSIAYWTQAILQQAVADAGRKIYTGKFQAANSNTTDVSKLLAAFREEICKENGVPRTTIFNCVSVKIHMTQVSEFSNTAIINPITMNSTTGVNDWNPAFGSYSCGRSGSIMVIQAAVDFPVFFRLLTDSSTLPGGKRVLQAATVFRSEPFDATASCS